MAEAFCNAHFFVAKVHLILRRIAHAHELPVQVQREVRPIWRSLNVMQPSVSAPERWRPRWEPAHLPSTGAYGPPTVVFGGPIFAPERRRFRASGVGGHLGPYVAAHVAHTGPTTPCAYGLRSRRGAGPKMQASSRVRPQVSKSGGKSFRGGPKCAPRPLCVAASRRRFLASFRNQCGCGAIPWPRC